MNDDSMNTQLDCGEKKIVVGEVGDMRDLGFGKIDVGSLTEKRALAVFFTDCESEGCSLGALRAGGYGLRVRAIFWDYSVDFLTLTFVSQQENFNPEQVLVQV